MTSERSEGSRLRERVRQAIAAPVAESERLLADLRDTDAERKLAILASGWFRGLAAALEELAIAVDDLLERPGAESRIALPRERGVEEPSPVVPAETPEPVDLSDADAEQVIDTARKSREDATNLRREAEGARRRLES